MLNITETKKYIVMDISALGLWIIGILLVFGWLVLPQSIRTLVATMGCLIQVPHVIVNIAVVGYTDGNYFKMTVGGIVALILSIIGITGIIVYLNKKD